ncbi:phosphoesterase [Entophlyctis helioformis]|nr:phosphoesterase [Entophlyctis helioformis]
MMQVSALVFAAVATVLSATTQAAPIKNVVVLVMENRSFDSFLGRLKWDGLNTKVNGLVGDEFNLLPNGTKIPVGRINLNINKYDPGHEIQEVSQQLYNTVATTTAGLTPNMAGFAANALAKNKNRQAITEVMGAYGPDTLPVTYALAREYTVVDDWFSSVPGPTYPNRHFVHCATSLGRTGNSDLLSGLQVRTIWDSLNEAKVDWKVYAAGSLSSTLLYSSMRGGDNKARTKGIKDFTADAAAGKLPKYSYIDPDTNENDNHPPHELVKGEAFVKKVYETLRASPQWNQTLFLITYDEHGGYYDHVVPPSGVPIPDASPVKPPFGDFKFDRLGVRVPTIVISPWVPKGGVVSSTVAGRNYEHSSIPATIKKVFGLPNFLTKRDAWALPFDDIASLAAPRTDCPATIPTVYVP